MSDVSNVVTSNSTPSLQFFKVLKKNVIVILLITILCGLLGTMYSVMKVKPVYTASREVILKTAIVNTDETSSIVTGTVSLSKRYLEQLPSVIKGPSVIGLANEKYGVEGDGLSAGAVSVNIGNEESLIFKMSYRAQDPDVAKAKLAVLIDAASERLPIVIEASTVSLISVQNTADISVSSSFSKYIILGLFAGLIIAIAFVFIKNALDNTVKDKSEFESLTGVNVIAVIDLDDDKQ